MLSLRSTDNHSYKEQRPGIILTNQAVCKARMAKGTYPTDDFDDSQCTPGLEHKFIHTDLSQSHELIYTEFSPKVQIRTLVQCDATRSTALSEIGDLSAVHVDPVAGSGGSELSHTTSLCLLEMQTPLCRIAGWEGPGSGWAL